MRTIKQVFPNDNGLWDRIEGPLKHGYLCDILMERIQEPLQELIEDEVQVHLCVTVHRWPK